MKPSYNPNPLRFSMSSLKPIELVPGLTYYQRNDGIFVFACKQMTAEIINVCFSYLHASEDATKEENQHIRTLIDIRGGWFVSPSLVTQSILAEAKTPNSLHGYIAIIGDGIASRVMQNIFHRLPTHLSKSIRMFTDEPSALEWLNQR